MPLAPAITYAAATAIAAGERSYLNRTAANRIVYQRQPLRLRNYIAARLTCLR